MSNSAGFSPIPCFEQTENEMAIRRSWILASDFGFFRAALFSGHFLKRIVHTKGAEEFHRRAAGQGHRLGEGNLPAGHRGMGRETDERTFQRARI
jgi:hypothetical protein